MIFSNKCTVCGGEEFTYSEVLWSVLISQWELLAHEVEYINRQQGFVCNGCGNNLRSMALAYAIMKKYEFNGLLRDFVNSDTASNLKILEINEAGGLTPTLSQIPNHLLIKYPEYDMRTLPFDNESFDLVIHSDTLEHIDDPIKALTECKRVLNKKGTCLFTIPIIVDRLTRTRQGLEPSFHGDNATSESDLIVHTEFGVDFWLYPIKAGFERLTMHAFEYPAALVLQAE